MTVCSALHRGTGFPLKMAWDFPTHETPPSIVYGILRGCGEIIRRCEKAKVDYWHIDHGYFRSGHYDGYYRITKNALAKSYDPDQKVLGDRWELLDLPIEPWRGNKDAPYLFCPPTPNIVSHFNLGDWETQTVAKYSFSRDEYKVRRKGDSEPVADAIRGSMGVVTFNSNVAVEALRLGVYAFADYGPAKRFWEDDDRLSLFQQLAYAQFTLDEMSSGFAWKHVL